MTISPFAPHGGTLLEVRGRILVFQPRGAGNVEEIERLLLKIDAVVPTLQRAHWAVLIRAEDDHLLIPDAEARLRLKAAELERTGQVATAIVAREGATGAILESQFRRIYQKTKCQVERFRLEADAVDWLHELLPGQVCPDQA